MSSSRRPQNTWVVLYRSRLPGGRPGVLTSLSGSFFLSATVTRCLWWTPAFSSTSIPPHWDCLLLPAALGLFSRFDPQVGCLFTEHLRQSGNVSNTSIILCLLTVFSSVPPNIFKSFLHFYIFTPKSASRCRSVFLWLFVSFLSWRMGTTWMWCWDFLRFLPLNALLTSTVR